MARDEMDFGTDDEGCDDGDCDEGSDTSGGSDTRTRVVVTMLTDAEQLDRGRALVEALREKARTADAARAAARHWKERLGAQQLEIERLEEVVVTGREELEVAVRVERDFAAGVYREVRVDTGAAVEERPLSAAERQQELFDEPAMTEDERAAHAEVIEEYVETYGVTTIAPVEEDDVSTLDAPTTRKRGRA